MPRHRKQRVVRRNAPTTSDQSPMARKKSPVDTRKKYHRTPRSGWQNQGWNMMPDSVVLFATVILLFPMGYLLLAAPAFLLVKLDIPPVGLLLRAMFNGYFLTTERCRNRRNHRRCTGWSPRPHHRHRFDRRARDRVAPLVLAPDGCPPS